MSSAKLQQEGGGAPRLAPLQVRVGNRVLVDVRVIGGLLTGLDPPARYGSLCTKQPVIYTAARVNTRVGLDAKVSPGIRKSGSHMKSPGIHRDGLVHELHLFLVTCLRVKQLA